MEHSLQFEKRGHEGWKEELVVHQELSDVYAGVVQVWKEAGRGGCHVQLLRSEKTFWKRGKLQFGQA